MKLREWTIDGLQVSGEWKKIYTSVDGTYLQAYDKLKFIFRGNGGIPCFVGLKKGKIVDK